MSKVLVGIDPGKSGGLCRMEGTKAVALCPMPVTDGEISTLGIRGILDGCDEVWIEKVGAMPGQGVTSMFTFGRSYGKIIGIVESMGIPLFYVTPQKWQKSIELPAKAGKCGVAAWAASAYPGVRLLASDRCTKPHDGMVDALAIAYHGATQGGSK